MASLGSQLLESSVELACPRCTYPVWILWAEIEAEAYVRCPVCRSLVHLVDQEATVRNAAADIEAEVRRAVGRLFK